MSVIYTVTDLFVKNVNKGLGTDWVRQFLNFQLANAERCFSISIYFRTFAHYFITTIN